MAKGKPAPKTMPAKAFMPMPKTAKATGKGAPKQPSRRNKSC
jgi:hypothetical protein